jgi:5-methylcytosine-specific restriction endonuclease McrA
MNDTLVVDSTSRPIGFCTWQDAIKLMYEGVVIVLKEDQEKEIHSQHLTMKIPRVVLVKDYVSKQTRETVSLTHRNIAIRDDRKCQYCGEVLSYDDQTLDHIIPRSRGGKNTWENLVLCCKPCNRKKADFLLSEISEMKLIKIPTKPKPGIQYSQLDKLRPEWKDWAQ